MISPANRAYRHPMRRSWSESPAMGTIATQQEAAGDQRGGHRAEEHRLLRRVVERPGERQVGQQERDGEPDSGEDTDRCDVMPGQVRSELGMGEPGREIRPRENPDRLADQEAERDAEYHRVGEQPGADADAHTGRQEGEGGYGDSGGDRPYMMLVDLDRRPLLPRIRDHPRHQTECDAG